MIIEIIISYATKVISFHRHLLQSKFSVYKHILLILTFTQIFETHLDFFFKHIQVAMTKMHTAIASVIVMIITATTATMTCEKSLSLSIVPLLIICTCPKLYSSVLDMNTFINCQEVN